MPKETQISSTQIENRLAELTTKIAAGLAVQAAAIAAGKPFDGAALVALDIEKRAACDALEARYQTEAVEYEARRREHEAKSIADRWAVNRAEIEAAIEGRQAAVAACDKAIAEMIERLVKVREATQSLAESYRDHTGGAFPYGTQSITDGEFGRALGNALVKRDHRGRLCRGLTTRETQNTSLLVASNSSTPLSTVTSTPHQSMMRLQHDVSCRGDALDGLRDGSTEMSALRDSAALANENRLNGL